MSVRRVVLAAVLLALPLAYFFLFVNDPLPARSRLEIDWDRVRALAGPVEAGPREVRSEVVARGRFFGWMICAGCGWGGVPMEFRTYQLAYADASSVVIDAVHDAERHAAMPMMADYDPEAFAHQTVALRRADRILLTHEHWDHASGLLAVIEDAAVRPHLLIPQAQRHSIAMREAGLSEDSFAGLPEAADVELRPVAPGVVAIAMPGHTPGSQVVYVRRADGVEYLFLGDITWNARNLRERRGKSLLIGLVAGEDRERIAEQIAYFSDLATAESTSSSPFALVVAHDPEQNAALVEAGLLEPGLVLNAPYSVVPGWPALEPGFAIGETSGVGVDGHGHVFLFHRGPGPSILGLDPSDGRIVVRFGEGVFSNPHGLAIGPNDEIWVTDTLRHQVLRFSHEGELLATIGEQGVPGDDLAHFDQPTDLAFSSTGEIYVSDGYGNSRVVRLSKEGKAIATWGRKGGAPGEFDLPHGIAIDARDRIYVADRGNQRVQVFDRDGNPLAAWGPEIFGRGSRAWGVEVHGDRLFVIDGGHMNPEVEGYARITRIDLDGRVEAQWSRYGAAPGELAWGHDLAVGPDGSVYTAEVRINNRIQKFVPAPSSRERERDELARVIGRADGDDDVLLAVDRVGDR